MSCTLATLSACFTLQGVHIDAGIALMHDHEVPSIERCAARNLAPGCAWAYDITHVDNPFGIVAVGYSVEFRKVRWDLPLRHQSSIPTSDLGENSAQLTVSWHPWGHQ